MSANLEFIKDLLSKEIKLNLQVKTSVNLEDVIVAVEDAQKRFIKYEMVDESNLNYFSGELKTKLTTHFTNIYTQTISTQTKTLSDPDFKSWYEKENFDHYYWNRFEYYVKQQLSPNIVEQLANDVDVVVSNLGNPSGEKAWKRKGLVYGQVQSGKTMHYTGVINKAADIGYKLIVLLTTNNEKLRRQTQRRLERDFVGYYSDIEQPLQIGVAKALLESGETKLKNPGCLTTLKADFKEDNAKKMPSPPPSDMEPYILVLKKNDSVLRNVAKWLEKNESYRSLPMLLIDDEADHSSINTKYNKKVSKKDREKSELEGNKAAQIVKKSGGSFDKQQEQRQLAENQFISNQKITAINRALRKLLNASTQCTFISYSATPFANIFIDPESDSDDVGIDLFPEHFLVRLSRNNKYYGIKKMFNTDEPHYHKIHYPQGFTYLEEELDLDKEDQKRSYFSHSHDDQNDIVPHNISPIPKDDLDVQSFMKIGIQNLPETLKEAVRYFLLAKVVRFKRENISSDNTMLINTNLISRMDQLKYLVKKYLETLLNSIKSYSQINIDDALEDKNIKQLYDLWEKEKTLRFDFENQLKNNTSKEVFEKEILRALVISENIKVISIHSKSDDQLVYSHESSESQPIDVIAIGGFTFGRGYTLEGLMVSYVIRNIRDMDTLLQTARWFGYRDTYSDLHKVWLTNELIHEFYITTKAVVNLEDEFEKMAFQKKTPKDFGLYVKYNPDIIQITAKNKIGFGQKITYNVSYSNSTGGPFILDVNKHAIDTNTKAFHTFNNSIKHKYISDITTREKYGINKGHYIYRNVECKYIIDMMDSFISPDNAAPKSNVDAILKWIEIYKDDLYREWDVVFIGVSGSEIGFESFDDFKLGYLQRQGRTLVNYDYSKNRISNSSNNFFDASSRKYFFYMDQEKKNIRTNPLLLLGFNKLSKIKALSEKDSSKINWTLDKWDDENPAIPIFQVQFPSHGDDIENEQQSVLVNAPLWADPYQLSLIGDTNYYEDTDDEG